MFSRGIYLTVTFVPQVEVSIVPQARRQRTGKSACIGDAYLGSPPDETLLLVRFVLKAVFCC